MRGLREASENIGMQKEMVSETFTELRRFNQMLADVSQHHLQISTNTLRAFIIIGLEEGVTVNEVKDRLGTTSGVASRSIAVLKKTHRKGMSGLDWVYTIPDPLDERVRHCRLTDKGRRMFVHLKNISKGQYS